MVWGWLEDSFGDDGWSLYEIIRTPEIWFPFVGGLLFMMSGCCGLRVWWLVLFINGEFDPGSGRTLAACLTHASRTVKPFGVDQWRTGE